MKHTKQLLWPLAMLAGLVLAGCEGAPTRDPAYAPVMPEPQPVVTNNSGTIYRAGYTRFLFEDNRARRVGDILTVQLSERTDASKKTETTVDKDTSLDVDNPTVFGTSPQFDLPSFVPLAVTDNLNLDINAKSSHSFDGSGESSQSNSLEGSVTVVVAEVLANGNLVVRGEKIVTLNRGPEHIRISGIVRPDDISANNTVSSTRLANVEIKYGGDGEVASASKLGWIARFFISALMPF